MTPFSKKCEILGELWLKYREDENFEDFIQYNDLGLPLAYAISESVVGSTQKAEMIINETWLLLLESLELSDGVLFQSLDEVLAE